MKLSPSLKERATSSLALTPRDPTKYHRPGKHCQMKGQREGSPLMAAPAVSWAAASQLSGSAAGPLLWLTHHQKLAIPLTSQTKHAYCSSTGLQWVLKRRDAIGMLLTVGGWRSAVSTYCKEIGAFEGQFALLPRLQLCPVLNEVISIFLSVESDRHYETKQLGRRH